MPDESRRPPSPGSPPGGDPAALRTVTELDAPSGQHLYLVTIDHAGPRVMTLTRGSTIIVGRARECDVALDQLAISRRHFAVEVGTPLLLKDLGGSNGTKLNGQRLAANASVPVGIGEMVEAGGVFFVVHDRMPHQLLGRPSRGAGIGGESPPSADVVISDPAMQRLYELVSLVAASTIPVLVVGETGVGKELIAAAIHQRSPRANEPYVCLNCAALPENLLESELFGYEKGAFSGAVQAKRGLIEGADGGTLFLDEVGEMALSTQAKLLRVLENGELMRLGGLKAQTVDVRFVAATNRSLPALVAKGTFRRDLYFRLNGMTIPVPPLRERPGEIPALARFLLARSAKRQGMACPSVSEEAIARLKEHAWPGNVRELRNVMDRALTLCRTGTLRVADIVIDRELERAPEASEAAPVRPETSGVRPAASVAPTGPGSPAAPGRLTRTQEEEQALIRRALEEAGGNQGKAAESLGISRRTLVNRLNEYGFKRPRKA